jgi:hypothetical protein
MKTGLSELAPTLAGSAIFVDPEAALTEIRRMEDTLRSLRGTLLICDPYIENKTLDFLSECNAASAIRLMTTNVLKETTLRRDLSAFMKEHQPDTELRVRDGLHDRYIIHDGGMLLLGASLNGFAKKQSFVVGMGPDIAAATRTAFNKLWSVAAKF